MHVARAGPAALYAEDAEESCEAYMCNAERRESKENEFRVIRIGIPNSLLPFFFSTRVDVRCRRPSRLKRSRGGRIHHSGSYVEDLRSRDAPGKGRPSNLI